MSLSRRARSCATVLGTATDEEEHVAQSRSMLPAETGHWWALALRGGVAILFGIAALLRPGIALEALILLFGAYALVDGVFAVVGVFTGTRTPPAVGAR